MASIPPRVSTLSRPAFPDSQNRNQDNKIQPDPSAEPMTAKEIYIEMGPPSKDTRGFV